MLAASPAMAAGSSTTVQQDVDTLIALIKQLRDSLPSHDKLTWKAVCDDHRFQAAFAERLSSCFSAAKARKLIRFAAPRLIIGEHDDVVITLLYEGNVADMGPVVGAQAQERQKNALQMHEAAHRSQVDRRKAAVERAKQMRRDGSIITGVTSSGEVVVEEIVEEVEEVEEIDEDVSTGAAETSGAPPAVSALEVVTAPPEAQPDDDWDVPPPPDADDWDVPPPPPEGDDWDVPPPPPPGDDEDWDIPPPPPT